MKRHRPSQPPQEDLGAQLDHFLGSCWLPAHWAKRLWRPSELPVRLERYVRLLPAHMQWRAHSDDSRTYCAVGHRAAGFAHKSSGTALQVYFLDADASTFAGGVWEYDCGSGWCLRNVVDGAPRIRSAVPRHRETLSWERRQPADEVFGTISFKVLP